MTWLVTLPDTTSRTFETRELARTFAKDHGGAVTKAPAPEAVSAPHVGTSTLLRDAIDQAPRRSAEPKGATKRIQELCATMPDADRATMILAALAQGFARGTVLTQVSLFRRSRSAA